MPLMIFIVISLFSFVWTSCMRCVALVVSVTSCKVLVRRLPSPTSCTSMLRKWTALGQGLLCFWFSQRILCKHIALRQSLACSHWGTHELVWYENASKRARERERESHVMSRTYAHIVWNKDHLRCSGWSLGLGNLWQHLAPSGNWLMMKWVWTLQDFCELTVSWLSYCKCFHAYHTIVIIVDTAPHEIWSV